MDKRRKRPKRSGASHVEGSPWARDLYALFAPVREGLKGVPEDEINEAIDEAVKEVRVQEA